MILCTLLGPRTYVYEVDVLDGKNIITYIDIFNRLYHKHKLNILINYMS